MIGSFWDAVQYRPCPSSRSYVPSPERLPPRTALKPDVPPLTSAVRGFTLLRGAVPDSTIKLRQLTPFVVRRQPPSISERLTFSLNAASSRRRQQIRTQYSARCHDTASTRRHGVLAGRFNRAGVSPHVDAAAMEGAYHPLARANLHGLGGCPVSGGNGRAYLRHDRSVCRIRHSEARFCRRHALAGISQLHAPAHIS